MAQYTIDITNGTGTQAILEGSYTATATVNGYNNLSIDPSTLTVSGTTTYDFTIAATGTLTLHVSEEGTSGGTDIVGATFRRCDPLGNMYGSVITSDEDGNAVFPYVPFGSSAPAVYYRQTASDGSHNFDGALKNVTLSTETLTVEIANSAAAIKTINLTDFNYSGLPIVSGSIDLE